MFKEKWIDIVAAEGRLLHTVRGFSIPHFHFSCCILRDFFCGSFWGRLEKKRKKTKKKLNILLLEFLLCL